MIHFKISMLKIIADSSLFNSIEELQVSLRKQLRELAHAGPGFSLNPESVNKSKDVYNYVKSEEVNNTRIILWHDLINNTITPHKRVWEIWGSAHLSFRQCKRIYQRQSCQVVTGAMLHQIRESNLQSKE